MVKVSGPTVIVGFVGLLVGGLFVEAVERHYGRPISGFLQEYNGDSNVDLMISDRGGDRYLLLGVDRYHFVAPDVLRDEAIAPLEERSEAQVDSIESYYNTLKAYEK